MISAFCDEDGHTFEAVHATNALRPLLQDDRYGVVYLIEQGGRAVGYGVVTWGWSLRSGGRGALIDQLYVDPSNAGLGASALEEIVDDLKSRRVPTVEVTARPRNQGLRALAEAHGFEADDSLRLVRPL